MFSVELGLIFKHCFDKFTALEVSIDKFIFIIIIFDRSGASNLINSFQWQQLRLKSEICLLLLLEESKDLRELFLMFFFFIPKRVYTFNGESDSNWTADDNVQYYISFFMNSIFQNIYI